ncbi:MAG: hypothetical protein ACHQ0Y_14570 [Thermodesulfovibrionales bacterium]
MLLLSANRMRGVARYYVIGLLFLAFCCPAYGDDATTKAQGDLIIRTKKSGDLLTSPKKTASPQDNAIKKTVAGSKQPAAAQASSVSAEELLKPSKNYLDVYLGACQPTPEAISAVKRFLASHTGFAAQYFMMNTQSDKAPDMSGAKGIEFYLPLDARRYDIRTVPSFILNKDGVSYKITGVAEISDIYDEIEKKTVQGEKKGEYIDLGERGRGCRALAPDFRPTSLTAEQRKEVMREQQLPPRGLTLRDPITLPEQNAPVHIVKEADAIRGLKTFVVFSERHKTWAKQQFAAGATGCCTDCVKLDGLWPHAQYCTKEMLAKLGVNGVPTTITFGRNAAN